MYYGGGVGVADKTLSELKKLLALEYLHQMYIFFFEDDNDFFKVIFQVFNHQPWSACLIITHTRGDLQQKSDYLDFFT
jgi:hypothetical protein